MTISMDPEIYQAFQASQHVSRQNGISGHLMKESANRRRSKVEIEEEKKESARKEQEIREKLAAWTDMERMLEESEKEKDLYKRQADVTQNLYNEGMIKKNDDGSYGIVGSPEEQAEKKARRSKPKRRNDPLNFEQSSVDLGLDEEDIEDS